MNTNTAAVTNAPIVNANDYHGDYLVYTVDGCTVMEEIDAIVLDLGGTEI